MDIISSAISAVSGVLILYIQITVINLTSRGQMIRSRVWASFFAAAIFDFATELCFNIFPGSVNFFLTLISGFKSCALIWFCRGKCRISDALIAIIIQEFCAVTYSVIYISLSYEIRRLQYARVITQLVVVMIMTLIIVLFKRFGKLKASLKNISALIPNRVMFFIYLSLFTESGIVEIVGFDNTDTSERTSFVKLLLFILTAINAVIIVSLIVSVIAQNFNDNLNQVLGKQIEIQLNHYEKMEKLNVEMRGFRHDFNNHIKCLESMMDMRKYSETKEYLKKLSDMIPLGEFLFKTGNYIADAILTEMREANNNIIIKFSGIIPQSIDNFNLCVILSNAMNNAIEACATLHGDNTISVYGNYQQGIFVLIISNPTAKNGYFEDVLPETTKSDKNAHGFGLLNIQRIVNKYGGTMHTLLKDGTFTLSLTLSINQTVHL